ncbi:pyridoxal phosphate biosynthetic protein PdxA [Prevotella sp. CAG:732]|nr:4-hydroxythreonine-4-phosphate dehydrogenase PdxA [Prevotella sp. CAG:732]CDD18236.1 pyridoxal phosphate biosynthetic protein PdxA [Prevotella sp. CAG:732]
MDNQNVRVAITHGDTNGIGYELIFKAFAEPEMLELCTPIIYGSPKVAAYYRKAMNLPGQFSIIQKAEDAQDGRINLLAAVEEEVKVDMGMPTPESGQAAVKALDRAMTDYRNGLYDVLVTAPINNGNAQIENYPFQGHKKYIETCLGEGKKGLSILVGGNLRIASVTEKTPLKEVAAGITTDAIVEKVTLMQQTLKRDFMITNPRIAVLSLNPKSNEDTSCGIEEREVIIPAIDALAEKGVQAFGPYASDEFFGQGYFADFDGVMAMYHDQATIPFHSLYTEDGVIYTAGLPIIRTTADVTPSFSIAGTGHADETSFRHAIYLAIDAFRHRNDYDEASANPLPKLYHEKRDESEKVRFSIPKKHSNAPFNPNAEVKS